MRIGRQMDETLRLHSDKSRQQRYNYILQLLHDVGLDDPDRYTEHTHICFPEECFSVSLSQWL